MNNVGVNGGENDALQTRPRWLTIAHWVLLCGVVGLPALASLWLLYPRREPLPVASPALA